MEQLVTYLAEVDDVVTSTSNDAGSRNTRTSQVDGVIASTTKKS